MDFVVSRMPSYSFQGFYFQFLFLLIMFYGCTHIHAHTLVHMGFIVTSIPFREMMDYIYCIKDPGRCQNMGGFFGTDSFHIPVYEHSDLVFLFENNHFYISASQCYAQANFIVMLFI